MILMIHQIALRSICEIYIPISPVYIDRILEMPLIHKDPFDRMIIAQAQTENLTIITHDSMIPLYDVNILK